MRPHNMKTLHHPLRIPHLRTASPLRATSFTHPSATQHRLTNHNRFAHYPHRTFVTNPFPNPFASTPQTITATRTLHRPVRLIYDIISDVGAYSTFLPYCLSSRVTRRSRPAQPDGRAYAEEAELVIGFGSGGGGGGGAFSEAFWSRIYCVPCRVIETVAGPETETALARADIAHHSPRPRQQEDPTRSGNVLSHLRTCWTFRPEKDSKGGEKTVVDLAIEFQFANPVYAALSQAAAPRVAEQLIEAFEKRVQTVVEGRQ